MALDAHGDIYVADTGNDRVVAFSPTGTVLAVADANPKHYGCSDAVDMVNVDDLGRIYLHAVGFCPRPDGGSTRAHDRTMAFSPHGKLLHVWTSRQPPIAPMVGPGLFLCGRVGPSLGNIRDRVISPRFCDGHGYGTNNEGPILAIDRGGNVYAAYNTVLTRPNGFYHGPIPPDAAVVQFLPTGTVVRRYGDFRSGDPNHGRGVVGEYRFTIPDALAVDALGRIYVGNHDEDAVPAANSDTTVWGGRGQIVVLSPVGKTLAVWRGLRAPISIAIDDHGRVYVLDAALGCVLRYSERGVRENRWCSS